MDRRPAPGETLFLSTFTVTELRAGVALLPAGKRRTRLQDDMEKLVLPLFAGQVALRPALYPGLCRSGDQDPQGRVALAAADGYIAAIALASGFAVASRDTTPFEAAGVTVLNPWRGLCRGLPIEHNES